jgi:hypothetical protein
MATQGMAMAQRRHKRGRAIGEKLSKIVRKGKMHETNVAVVELGADRQLSL